MENLGTASRDELIAIIEALMVRVEALEEEVRRLRGGKGGGTALAVSATDNLAERSLRASLIARKISGGTRSPKGSATRMGLMSLLGTWAAPGKGQLQGCRELLLPTPAP